MTNRHEFGLPARTPGVLSRAVGDEFVVIHPGTQTAHALTGLPAQVWRATGGAAPVPVVPGTELDAAIAQLQGLELLESHGPTRRAMLRRVGVLAAVTGIASIALPEAAAAASTIVGPTTVTGNSSFTIPTGSRNVTITFTGGGGGFAQDLSGAAGSGGSITFNPGVTLASALTVAYNIGTQGSAPTSAGNTAISTPGGTGAFAGGAGGGNSQTSSPDLGGGGGGASSVTLSGAVAGTLVAGGGGGAGDGATVKGGNGGSVLASGAGGPGTTSGAGAGAGGAGGASTASGAAGGSGITAGTSPHTNGGGGGGGGSSAGTAGVNGSTTTDGGGGGAGASYIPTLTGQAVAAPTFGTVAGPAAGFLTYSYTAP